MNSLSEGGTGGRLRRGVAAARVRSFLITVALLLVAALSGCGEGDRDDLRDNCQRLGICEGAPRPPVLVDLVCDRSIGAPCTREVVTETLNAFLPQLARRPGSQMKLWGQGVSAAETTLLGTAESTAPRRGGARVVRTHEERFVRSAREQLLRSAESFFQAAPLRRSPIAEALTLIAQTAPPRPGMTRIIVISTDLREVNARDDFECYGLPDARRLIARWQRAHYLTPGSLTNIRVVFANTQLRPVEGRDCPATLARAAVIENIWRQAVQAAGAAEVRFVRGAATFDESPTDGGRLRTDGGAP